MGVPAHQGDFLDVIATWPEEEQTRANQAILEMEEEVGLGFLLQPAPITLWHQHWEHSRCTLQALERMAVSPGVIELCSLLDSNRIPRALLTRNTTESVQHFYQHHFKLPPFNPSLARDFRPFKPSPAAILHICKVRASSASHKAAFRVLCAGPNVAFLGCAGMGHLSAGRGDDWRLAQGRCEALACAEMYLLCSLR